MAKNWSDYFLEGFNKSQDRSMAMAQLAAESKFKKWVGENKIKEAETDQAFKEKKMMFELLQKTQPTTYTMPDPDNPGQERTYVIGGQTNPQIQSAIDAYFGTQQGGQPQPNQPVVPPQIQPQGVPQGMPMGGQSIGAGLPGGVMPPQQQVIPPQMGGQGIPGKEFMIQNGKVTVKNAPAAAGGETDASKIKSSLKTGKYNFELVSGNMNDLAQLYADALKEGSVGDVYRNKFSDVAMKGTFGKGLQDKYTVKPQLPGKITEIITKMMPMLTQQIGKEGSVRLVSTVFDALKKTVSEGDFSGEQTKGMLEQSIRSMYRVVRALDKLNIDEKQVGAYGDDFEGYILDTAGTIELSMDEEKALSTLIDNALSPLDKVSKDTKSKERFKRYLEIRGGK